MFGTRDPATAYLLSGTRHRPMRLRHLRCTSKKHFSHQRRKPFHDPPTLTEHLPSALRITSPLGVLPQAH